MLLRWSEFLTSHHTTYHEGVGTSFTRVDTIVGGRAMADPKCSWLRIVAHTIFGATGLGFDAQVKKANRKLALPKTSKSELAYNIARTSDRKLDRW